MTYNIIIIITIIMYYSVYKVDYRGAAATKNLQGVLGATPEKFNICFYRNWQELYMNVRLKCRPKDGQVRLFIQFLKHRWLIDFISFDLKGGSLFYILKDI